MSDENKETTDETQDEAQQDAGPVAAEDSSSSQAAGEEPSATPPASDAPADEASDAPASEAEEVPAADEGSSDEAPAEQEAPVAEEAPAPPAEPNPEDDLPWKQRRRLQRSRRPHEAGPTLNPEERAAARVQARKAKAAQRRKERATTKAKQPARGEGSAPAERDANAAKVRQGIVVSNKGDKSITVRIDIARRHPTYEKIVRRSRTLHAHDERNEAGEGDVVQVVETRPLSKTKRWRLVGILERAK
jgi:small subunit ribosomal protein S17